MNRKACIRKTMKKAALRIKDALADFFRKVNPGP